MCAIRCVSPYSCLLSPPQPPSSSSRERQIPESRLKRWDKEGEKQREERRTLLPDPSIPQAAELQDRPSFLDTVEVAEAHADCKRFHQFHAAIAAYFAFLGMQRRLLGDNAGPKGVDRAGISTYVGHLRTQAKMSYTNSQNVSVSSHHSFTPASF